MDLSNCNIAHIKTCNNDNIGIKSAYLYFNDFPLFLAFLLIFINYANMITCTFDHGKKGLCLSFNLVQILVIKTKSS